MDLEILNRCPLCGSNALRRWHSAPDRAYATQVQGFYYSLCLECSIRFLRRRPAIATAGELYDDLYEPYDVGVTRPALPVEFGVGPLSRLPAAWIGLVRPLYRAPSPDARFLDFGCGSPFFLRAAAQAGWKVVGADFSASVVERVRAANIDAYHVDEVWPILTDEPVDLVRMNHVLEHLYDPVATLRRVFDVLRPGGAVHVAIPNPVGFSASIFRRHWFALEPRHVFHFSPRMARSVLAQAGFKNVTVGHQPSPADVRRSAEYALRERSVPARLDVMAGSPTADRAYAVTAAAAALLRRGDRLHVVGRR